MKAIQKLAATSCTAITNISSKCDSYGICLTVSPHKYLYYIYDYNQYQKIKDQENERRFERDTIKYHRDQEEIHENMKYVALRSEWHFNVNSILM